MIRVGKTTRVQSLEVVAVDHSAVDALLRAYEDGKVMRTVP